MSPRIDVTAAGADILFADDEPAMREMVADMLEAAGFRVRLAPDGASALLAVHQRRPDLVILDNRMGRPTGFEVCEELKSDPALEFIPVLLLTAQGDPENRVLGFHHGADDFLAKPFEPRELVARCRALLRQARRGLDRNPTSGLPGGEALRREFERRSERGEPFCLCYLDLDYF
jgi:DNA-binding response OmpR family regulator